MKQRSEHTLYETISYLHKKYIQPNNGKEETMSIVKGKKN